MNISLLLQYAAVLPLKGKDYKVLLYLLPRIRLQKYKKINQKELSEALNITKSNISISISNLIDNGILASDPNYRSNKAVKLCAYSDDELQLMINREVYGEEDLFGNLF